MSKQTIIPVVKTLYLCEGHIGFANHKTDLMGIFNALRPLSYPHVHPRFVIYAQLTSAIGQIPFYFDVTYSPTEQLVHTTSVRSLNFPSKEKIVQLACTIEGCRFNRYGRYLVELFCDAQWVADTTLELL